jgi:hypothetical protein
MLVARAPADPVKRADIGVQDLYHGEAARRLSPRGLSECGRFSKLRWLPSNFEPPCCAARLAARNADWVKAASSSRRKLARQRRLAAQFERLAVRGTKREAEIASGLNHPHIVTVYHVAVSPAWEPPARC